MIILGFCLFVLVLFFLGVTILNTIKGKKTERKIIHKKGREFYDKRGEI